MLKILRWLRGYVTFEAKGPFPERFLNLTLRADILLWDPVGENKPFRLPVADTACKTVGSTSARKKAYGAAVYNP